jgi:hypothetical protein
MDDLRYEDASSSEYALLDKVRSEFFRELFGAKIKIIFDLRKKSSGGKIVLAKVYKTNELIRHLTQEGLDELTKGTDLIIFIDKLFWSLVEEIDKIRVLRHELRHVAYCPEKKFPYQLIGHDVEDFEYEIRLNQDDIGWRKRVAELTSIAYQQQEEQEKEEKKNAKKVAKEAMKKSRSNLHEVFEQKK